MKVNQWTENTKSLRRCAWVLSKKDLGFHVHSLENKILFDPIDSKNLIDGRNVCLFFFQLYSSIFYFYLFRDFEQSVLIIECTTEYEWVWWKYFSYRSLNSWRLSFYCLRVEDIDIVYTFADKIRSNSLLRNRLYRSI